MNRRYIMIFGAILTLLSIFVAGSLFAQSGGGFDLSWSTIDGGGGESSGGNYAVHGTVGQADAGEMSGGTFSLSGGFWHASASGEITGTVLLQGRADHTSTVISAWLNGSLQQSAVADSAGQYTLSGLPAGTYTVTAVIGQYLDALNSSVIVVNNTTTNLSTIQLLAGDVDDNHIVNISDITILTGGYGTSCTAGNLVVVADINIDCTVSIQDMTLATGNFGAVGPTAWP